MAGITVWTDHKSPLLLDFMNLKIADIALRKEAIKAWAGLNGQNLEFLARQYSMGTSISTEGQFVDGDGFTMQLPVVSNGTIHTLDMVVVLTRSSNELIPWNLF